MITNHNCFQTFLLLSIQLLLSSTPIIGQHSSELKSDSGVQIRCFENERQALLMFKNEIINDYGRLSTWGIEENKRDCCKWSGVRCHNRTNHVTRLDLRAPSSGYILYHWFSDVPLLGKIISPSLLDLKHLTYLDLSQNYFYGAPIPEFIGSISELRYLNLDRANFSGLIPHHIGNLSKLQSLSLRNRELCSNNLEWLSHLRDLKYLDLSTVNLSMATNWLQEISKLNSIKELHLKETNPSEILPSSLPFINSSASTLAFLHLSFNFHISSSTFCWFLNFSSSLIFIDLFNSNMGGTIPNALGNMMSLEYLVLSGNFLEGGIPKSFGNMSSLILLALSSNRLSGQLSELMMNLSGTTEKKLQYLDLTNNMISGSFPDVVRLSSLKSLALDENNLKGCIPKKYLQLPNLFVLGLSYNNFTGPLPDFSFCPSLIALDLSNNKFSGISRESVSGLSNLVSLSLNSNLLEGIITEDHLLNLSRLETLDLSFNSLLKLKFSHQWVPPFQIVRMSLTNCELGPQFPKWIQNQKSLISLDISNARISDTIPTWFIYLATKLAYLNASNNQIIGSFPKIFFSTFHLTHNWTYSPSSDYQILDLSGNKISGSVTFLCDFPNLYVVDLSDNQLSNKLPECSVNFRYLVYLNLANNNFSGKIPDWFGFLHYFSWLNLRKNSFSGGIPTFLKDCTNLQMIDLGENRLTGKIPSWIGDGFPHLGLLSLRSNEFLGSIPSSICRLQTLQILDFSSNNISGPLPECLSNLTAMASTSQAAYAFFTVITYQVPLAAPPLNNNSTDVGHTTAQKILDTVKITWKGTYIKYVNNLKLVKLIDLSNNNLAGKIPAEITKLDDLIGLNLSRNNLIGSIPENIGELKSLDFLDLSRNHLSGGIPMSLSELSYLGTLNLSYNNLSGRIPDNSHMLTFEESAYAGNAGLCGRPLNKSCPNDNETPQQSNLNPKHEEEDDDDWLITKEFYIAMGVGFVIGFWGIFGTILFNKTVRFAILKVLNRIEDCAYVRVELSKARLRRHFQN